MLIPDDGIPIDRHGIVVGQTGVGKSNTMMIGIMRRIEDGQQVHIVDSKGELEQIFEGTAKIYTPDQCSDLLQTMIDVASQRMKMFSEEAKRRKVPIRDIAEYNKVTGAKLSIISVVIEELILIADYVDIDLITKLFVAGRSSGVFCFVLAQYLNSTVLPKTASNNLQTKVYMGPPDQYGLKALFPGGIPTAIMAEAERTLGEPGLALCFINNKFSMRQMPRISDDLIIRWMQ